MTGRKVAFCWLALVGLVGCGGRARAPQMDASAHKQWEGGRITRVRVAFEPLGEVGHSQLQLPVVSPDGEWIAYLQRRGDPVPMESLLTGQGLAAMALFVRSTGTDATERQICPAGAVWPTWSPDGRQLVFIVYGAGGECQLVARNVVTGQTRRLALPFTHAMMPAVSPSGDRVALVAAADQSDRWRLYVVALGGGSQQACPAGDTVTGQFLPQWTADGRIVFLSGEQDTTWLAEWGADEYPPQRLCEIDLAAWPTVVIQAFAGLGRPLDPAGRHFAYFDAAANHIVAVDLRDGKETSMPPATQAGCWVGPGRFVAASEDEMFLQRISADGPIRLLSGPSLPRWGRAAPDKGGDDLIVCGPGSRNLVLSVTRVKVLLAE